MLAGALIAYVVARSLDLTRLPFQSLSRALLLGAFGWGMATIGPTGTVWILLGLPSVAVLLVALYGWLEGMIVRAPLRSLWQLAERNSEEIS